MIFIKIFFFHVYFLTKLNIVYQNNYVTKKGVINGKSSECSSLIPTKQRSAHNHSQWN